MTPPPNPPYDRDMDTPLWLEILGATAFFAFGFVLLVLALVYSDQAAQRATWEQPVMVEGER